MKNRDIQALRGVAVLLVFLQHYRGRLPTPNWYFDIFNYAAFWGGVDIFFVVSGFVIAKSLIDRSDWGVRKRLSFISLKQFWYRRIRRLVPASWFWLFISSVLSIACVSITNGGMPSASITSAISAISGTSNFYWSWCITGFHVGSSCINPDFNGIYWSLSLEEQFYIVFSLMAFSISSRIMATLGIVIFALFTILGLFYLDQAFSLIWVSRPHGMILGVFIACFYPKIISYIRKRSKINVILCTWCAIFLVCLVSARVELRLSIPTISVLSGFIVVLALRGDGISSGVFGSALQWIGDRSYSMYLCHLSVIILIREVGFRLNGVEFVNGNGWGLFIIFFLSSLVMTFLVSDISYRYIENMRLFSFSKRQPT